MKCFSGMFCCVTILVVVTAPAADQDAQLQHNVLVPTLAGSSTEHADLFWGKFMASCDENLNQMLGDRFHPLQVMNWDIWLDSGSANARCSQAAGTTSHALTQSVVYGAREASIDLPVMEWLSEHQNWLADFFRNSLGSVDEESVSPMKLSYQPTERSWWQELSDRGNFCYGIRPFKTNPYAFFSWAVKDGDQMILLSHIRYHYENFADHNFELAMSLPLAKRCSLDLGTSYQFGRHEDQKRLTLKLSRGLFMGGIFNVGFELQQRPRLLVGLAVPW